MITLAQPLTSARFSPLCGSVPSRKDRVFSVAIALVLHALLLAGGGAFLTQSAEYGVEAGFGSVEVELVAAPAAPESAAPRVVPSALQKQVDVEEEVVPVVGQAPVAEAEKEKSLLSAPAPAAAPDVRGDGSSAVPGRDATTFRSAGGAQTDQKPFYLKNPAPRYPEAARRAGQEGLVLLRVEISSKGDAASVAVAGSSGHALLDDAAVVAVKKWRFRPASFAGVPVASAAEVPVRFTLDEGRRR